MSLHRSWNPDGFDALGRDDNFEVSSWEIAHDKLVHGHQPWLVNFSYPGVVVTESIAGGIPGTIPTFQTLFVIGTSLRGPAQVPTQITSIGQFTLQFKGGLASYLPMAINDWYSNSGPGSVYVTRVVGAGATEATAILTHTPEESAETIIEFTTIGPGADYNGVAGPPATGLSVQFQNGLLQILDAGVVIEQYNEATFASRAQMQQYVNGASNLVQMNWVDQTQDPDNTANPVQFAGGANGATVASTDILGDPSTNTGVYSLATKNLPLGYVTAPGYSQQIVGNGLIQMAVQYRRYALIDSTFGGNLSAWLTERNQYAEPTGRAAYIAGWIQEPNPNNNNALTWCPRSCARAAMIAASQNQPDSLANVGAGLAYTYANVTALETDGLDDNDQGTLNDAGIDVARNFTLQGQGRVQWAARTISTNVLYLFCNTPITLNVIAVAIETALKQYVFDVIDGQGILGAAIESTLTQLLFTMWQANILYGATFDQACYINVDTSNPLQLQNGILPIQVYVKTAPIAERIPVSLYLMQLAYNPVTQQISVTSIPSPSSVLPSS